MIRALALLIATLAVSTGLSWWFGAEVLAALGVILAQSKILLARMFSLGTGPLLAWLKMQGVNFARVEIGKRWFFRSLLPLLIGAAAQRRIAREAARLKSGIRARHDGLMRWYASLSRPVRVIAVLTAILATLALALTTMSLWLLVFTVQVPFWILATFGAFGQMIWNTVQKLAFRTIAFMHIGRLWTFLKRRLPDAALRRKRRLDYRVTRMVVRRRRMTVAQLHAQKYGLRMRAALICEYLRRRTATKVTSEKDSPKR